MTDWRVWAGILCAAAIGYAMRSGGFLMAGFMPAGGRIQQFLRLAPGNLFVAFCAAGCLQGGWPTIAGLAVALVAMILIKRDWVALLAGFLAAGLVAWF